MDLPPEDRPDTIDIGPILNIPIVDDDDPRLMEDRATWSAATRTAQALHSSDELLQGLRHHDWRVRHQSVARLVARARDDVRTLPALLKAAVHDRSWQVRDAVVWGLLAFGTGDVLAVIQAAGHDVHRDVRWSGRFALFQKGHGPHPGPFDSQAGLEGTSDFLVADELPGGRWTGSPHGRAADPSTAADA